MAAPDPRPRPGRAPRPRDAREARLAAPPHHRVRRAGRARAARRRRARAAARRRRAPPGRAPPIVLTWSRLRRVVQRWTPVDASSRGSRRRRARSRRTRPCGGCATRTRVAPVLPHGLRHLEVVVAASGWPSPFGTRPAHSSGAKRRAFFFGASLGTGLGVTATPPSIAPKRARSVRERRPPLRDDEEVQVVATLEREGIARAGRNADDERGTSPALELVAVDVEGRRPDLAEKDVAGPDRAGRPGVRRWVRYRRSSRRTGGRRAVRARPRGARSRRAPRESH